MVAAGVMAKSICKKSDDGYGINVFDLFGKNGSKHKGIGWPYG
ncbi:hypothetical protein ASY01nite_22320 [Acetobacter syzygii]|nr:hypothetical protein Absy_023_005 [Acetobacter syzygii]GEL57166.1 hypothetical protein ASY01nite_22320 [Acetobacter syzygii]